MTARNYPSGARNHSEILEPVDVLKLQAGAFKVERPDMCEGGGRNVGVAVGCINNSLATWKNGRGQGGGKMIGHKFNHGPYICPSRFGRNVDNSEKLSD